MSHTINPVYRGLNKPMTLCGVERRLFLCVAVLCVAMFNLFGALLPAGVLFVVLWFLARVATQTDAEILRILINSSRFAGRYDPAKWSPLRVEKRRNGPRSPSAR